MRSRKRKRNESDDENDDAERIEPEEVRFRTPQAKRTKIEDFGSIGKIGFAKNTREENRRISREFKSVELEEQLLNAELEELYSPQPKIPQPKLPAPEKPLPPPPSSIREELEFVETSSTRFLSDNTMPTLLGRVIRGETVMTPDALLDYFARVRYESGSGYA